MPATATPFEVRQAVEELMAQAWRHRKPRMKTIHRAFVLTARIHPFRFAMADLQNPKVSFGSALGRTVLLARRLRTVWAGQRMVGLLIPPSPAGAFVNFAAMLMGKVPVNLNYTVSEETIASCIRQCEIKSVLASRALMEKLKLKVPLETIFLEDLAGKSVADGAASRWKAPSIFEKATASLAAFLLPARWLERWLGCQKKAELDDLATVIFSSGSTGDPKGVMLSHYNLGSNVEQLEQVFALNARDRVLGILPFFHSFGFTGTLCLPATIGAGVVYHPNPLDAKTIGPLVSNNRVTFLLATPTFLQFYLRGCTAESFGSLRVVMAGAEKLPERLATAFEEKFGIHPLEGYGCTECGPAVAVNTHDFRAAGFRQVGAKRGTIGHPLPGVSVRIAALDSESGGANYRLSRFSKIGGEMVPHIRIEEKLQELAGAVEPCFVVTGVPDEKKGERLVVLHRLTEDKLKPCLDGLAQSDLPNLWKPRGDQFFHVDAFPVLGTGKLDLRKIKEMAGKLSATAGVPDVH
jgi:acyl-[acyl-carrier-protein]-phospholipid O-acyltransferase/long-chain-fatty-acid--[acyl-carrier-protein] ligase